MRRMKFIMSMLFAMAFGMQLMAQEVEIGDAFYIYRNDGDFNGFFYDRVQEMRFSRYDLDSLEHDEFVVQDVITADSIYRIPLAAIDSIGFVQPEIILNPKLYLSTDRGLDPYIYDLVPTALFLKDETPEDLIPKVGDVLIVPTSPIEYNDTGQVRDKGMGGTVTSVFRFRQGYGWRIDCEPIKDLHEVFIQFISTEELFTDEAGQSRRRVAMPRKVSGGADVPIININSTLKKELVENLMLDLDYGLYLGVEVDYNITWRSFFLKTAVKKRLTVQPTLTASGTLGKYNKDYNLIAKAPVILFPAACPILQFDPLPKLFFTAQGTINASLKMPKVGLSSTETFIVSDDGVGYNFNLKNEGDTFGKDGLAGFLSNSDMGISFEGLLYAGVKVQIGIRSIEWVKECVDTYLGVDLSIGPRVSGNVSFSVHDLFKDGGMYPALSNSKITGSPLYLNAEAKATWDFIWTDPEHETFAEIGTGFFEMEYYALPKIENFKAETNTETGETALSYRLVHRPLFDTGVGFHIKNLTTGEEEEYFPGTVYTYKNDSLSVLFNRALDPGMYSIAPMVEILGKRMLTGYHSTIYVTPYLRLKQKEYVIDSPAQGQKAILRVPIETNAKELSTTDGKIVGEGNSKTLELEYDPVNGFLDAYHNIQISAIGGGDYRLRSNDTINVCVRKAKDWLKTIYCEVGNKSCGIVRLSEDSKTVPVSVSYIDEQHIEITANWSNIKTTPWKSVPSLERRYWVGDTYTFHLCWGTETETRTNNFKMLVTCLDKKHYEIEYLSLENNYNRDVIQDGENTPGYWENGANVACPNNTPYHDEIFDKVEFHHLKFENGECDSSTEEEFTCYGSESDSKGWSDSYSKEPNSGFRISIFYNYEEPVITWPE